MLILLAASAVVAIVVNLPFVRRLRLEHRSRR